MYRIFLKPLFDRTGALLTLIALSPIFLIVAVLVRLKLGSPVIYAQRRPGKGAKPFVLYKFRTMTDERNSDGELMDDSIRLTRFGKSLRSTSLDEIPELFNILKGEMSFVGPRPLLMQYLPLYNDFQRRRHEVKPGLTGLAQVQGRNAISWEEKFTLDIHYVDNLSFVADMRIIMLTIKRVISREGINAENSPTMDLFEGSKTEAKIIR